MRRAEGTVALAGTGYLQGMQSPGATHSANFSRRASMVMGSLPLVRAMMFQASSRASSIASRVAGGKDAAFRSRNCRTRICSPEPPVTGVSGSLCCRCAERACLGHDRQFLVGLGNRHHGLFGDRIGQVVGEAAGLLSALSPMRRAVEFRRHSVGTTTRATVRFLAARSEASASLQLLVLLVLKLSAVCETNVGLGNPQHDALGDRIRKAP